MKAHRFPVVALAGIIALIIFCSLVYANIQYTNEGTAKIAVRFGSIQRIYKPADGWFTTIGPGWKAYDLNLKSFTETTTPRVTSKDNAALQVPISVTAATDWDRFKGFVFGLEDEQTAEPTVTPLTGLPVVGDDGKATFPVSFDQLPATT